MHLNYCCKVCFCSKRSDATCLFIILDSDLISSRGNQICKHLLAGSNFCFTDFQCRFLGFFILIYPRKLELCNGFSGSPFYSCGLVVDVCILNSFENLLYNFCCAGDDTPFGVV